jgi:hypothetical protein
MAKKLKRQRGGQPGNQNACKHGYYSSKFNQAEKFEFRLAAGIEGIAEEIALLRYEIKKAVSGGDIKNLVPLVKATTALEKLIRTHHRVFVGESKRLETAAGNVYRNVLMPFGVRIKTTDTGEKFYAMTAPLIKNEPNPITNSLENEADLTYNENRINEAN